MIEIKYPFSRNSNTDKKYLERCDKNSDYWVSRVINKYKNVVPPLNTIEIETINRCNNDCSFCPVNRNDDSREFKKMNEELFKKIIDELGRQEYSGYLSLFSNNEPLIDVRIYDFLKYAKIHVPNATHCLYTNGILLDENKFLKLIKYLDYLVVDNYSDDLCLLSNVDDIIKKYRNNTGNCKVSILVRRKNQVLSNRGGVAPNRNDCSTYISSCIFPFMQMVIRPDGKISKCCQDALGRGMLGDVSVDTISQVWSGDKYVEFRKELMENGRKLDAQCKNCDSFGFSNYFPDIWKSYLLISLVEEIWKQKNIGKKIYIYDDIKTSREMMKILSYHGIKIDGILKESDIDIIRNDSSFTIFTSNDYAILNAIDNEIELIGEKYIVFEEFENTSNLSDSKNNDEIIRLLEFLNIVKEKKTIIFGTGASAKKINSIFNFNVSYYIDNNEMKQGKVFEGKKIWLPQHLKEENKESICVIIASVKYREMREQLIKEGLCDSNRIYDGLRFINA